MAEQVVKLVDDTSNTGKSVRTIEQTISAKVVEQQVVTLANSGGTLSDTAAGANYTRLTDLTNSSQLASAANLSAANSGNGALIGSRPGEWIVTHAPAVATQATASKTAGGAGVRHVCTHVSGTVAVDATGATAALITLNLRDGATGAGSILATWTLANLATAGSLVPFNFGPMNVFGTAATAMTIETSAATGAHVAVSVTMTGYDVS